MMRGIYHGALMSLPFWAIVVAFVAWCV